MNATIRSFAPAAALLIAALYVLIQASGYLEANRRLSGAMNDVRRQTSTGARKSPAALEGVATALNAAAREARLRRLTSISVTGSGRESEISVEWESDLRSGLAFIGLLRDRGYAASLPRLSLTTVESIPGVVRGRASMRPGPAEKRLDIPGFRRDPFRPLWKADTGVAAVTAKNLRREEERRRKDLEKQAEARQAADAEARREARRIAAQSRYSLNGLAADGRGPLAFLKSNDGRTFTVRRGDRMEDVTVSDIDRGDGAVTLSGDGFSLVLRIGGTP